MEWKSFFFFFLLRFVSSMSLLFSFCNVLFIQIFVFFTACNKRELSLKTVVTHPKKRHTSWGKVTKMEKLFFGLGARTCGAPVSHILWLVKYSEIYDFCVGKLGDKITRGVAWSVWSITPRVLNNLSTKWFGDVLLWINIW